MASENIRLLFGALCVVGLFAIGAGLLFEWGRMRSETSVLSPRQSRWRIISGILWLLILASFAFATVFLWPSGPADVVTGQRFTAVIFGALLLLVIALIMTGFDVFLTIKGAQLQREKFDREAGKIAKAEIDRIRAQHGLSDTSSDTSKETE